MISKLTGTLARLTDTMAYLSVGAFEYEVFVTDYTRRGLQMRIDEAITLHTIDYLDGNPQKGGRLTPRIVGFDTEIEKEFFELFCSVPGLGVKMTLRAMVRPVRDIADAIEQQDVKTLTTLPGVGPAMAEKIIAQLRRKMAKFALLVQELPEDKTVQSQERGVVEETFQVLVALGHSEADARQLLETPLASKKKFKDVEQLLQAVYENRD